MPAEEESPFATNPVQLSEQENEQAEDQTQSSEPEAKQDSEQDTEQVIDREPDMEPLEFEEGLHSNDADDKQKPSVPIPTQSGKK